MPKTVLAVDNLDRMNFPQAPPLAFGSVDQQQTSYDDHLYAGFGYDDMGCGQQQGEAELKPVHLSRDPLSDPLPADPLPAAAGRSIAAPSGSGSAAEEAQLPAASTSTAASPGRYPSLFDVLASSPSSPVASNPRLHITVHTPSKIKGPSRIPGVCVECVCVCEHVRLLECVCVCVCVRACAHMHVSAFKNVCVLVCACV